MRKKQRVLGLTSCQMVLQRSPTLHDSYLKHNLCTMDLPAFLPLPGIPWLSRIAVGTFASCKEKTLSFIYLFATKKRKDIFLKQYLQVMVTGAGADHEELNAEILRWWEVKTLTLC